MSARKQGEITFDGLRRFLCRHGFDQTAKVQNSLAFQHRESGSIILLAIPDDGRSVRPADLLSVVVRLENQGIVDDSTLAQFKSGRLPMAS